MTGFSNWSFGFSLRGGYPVSLWKFYLRLAKYLEPEIVLTMSLTSIKTIFEKIR